VNCSVAPIDDLFRVSRRKRKIGQCACIGSAAANPRWSPLAKFAYQDYAVVSPISSPVVEQIFDDC
jgi:hypothetical protein